MVEWGQVCDLARPQRWPERTPRISVRPAFLLMHSVVVVDPRNVSVAFSKGSVAVRPQDERHQVPFHGHCVPVEQTEIHESTTECFKKAHHVLVPMSPCHVQDAVHKVDVGRGGVGGKEEAHTLCAPEFDGATEGVTPLPPSSTPQGSGPCYCCGRPAPLPQEAPILCPSCFSKMGEWAKTSSGKKSNLRRV